MSVTHMYALGGGAQRKWKVFIWYCFVILIEEPSDSPGNCFFFVTPLLILPKQVPVLFIIF